MSQNHSLLSLAIIGATAALAANRFATAAGAYPAAKGPAFGVTQSAIDLGGSGTADVLGTAVATAGGAITKGDYVQVAASGKVVTQSDGVTVGLALEDASDDGDLIEVLLIPSAPAASQAT